MNSQLEHLAARRMRLVAQAAAQRAVLAHQLEPWRPRLAVADRGIEIVRIAGRHPRLLAGAALLLAAWRPRRAFKWLQYGWVTWRVVRKLRST